MAESTDLSPVEWLGTLGPKLLARREKVEVWRRYYEGDHDLPVGPGQHKDAFIRFQKLARTNLCRLCAESMVHLTQVTGYRDVDSSDDAVWRLWQQARLDGRQFGIWRKAYSRSAAYVVVGVDRRDRRRPLVTIEGPENVIVETDPADARRRLAALRLWHDPLARRWFATVYLPGWRYRYRTKAQYKTAEVGGPLRFTPDRWEATAEPARSLAEVPVVPFLNGDEGEEPAAEFAAGMDVQDRLNLTVLNRLTAERYGAFRQRGLLNFDPEEDPVTGLPVPPFNPGADAVWTVPPPEPGDPEPKLFDFAQTETSGILRGAEADMRAFAAITITPVYYLPGDLVNIGADAVAALAAGHQAKVRQRHAQWGEDLEEVMQLMADVAGLDRDLSNSEIVWARPENLNPAQVADYAVKLVGAKFPITMVAEEIGWSPQRVQQLRAELAADALRAGFATPQAEPQTEASGSSADDIAKRVTAAGALIRAGFAPEASLRALGLDPIEHTGLVPVTVRSDAE
ncbi:phage portal protein [Pseudonocardia asaccharolytica]|uniref:Phage portal protein n=1 Tax=Pseudonocardia asaccharolytica DSM 44247 = NBRC 16224 TaxID=1123024 RepID=A0A511D3J1_9PSEU|nr:phage portal protein [Pseudonocardia asaccharolytica]GEL19351.1 hypothetical protein PA7_31880 [Pseudonocardia asaccharolytica DSM 44247 = NBRC 16224]